MTTESIEPQPTRSTTRKVLGELGLMSLYQSHASVKLLCTQRFVRLFAHGASTLVLVSFLRELGISTTHIGLLMTLTLAGDVAISFLLVLFADGVGRRVTLAIGALLMAGSGVVFALCINYWLLLAAAIFGVISPSGNEIGPFKAVEESIIAHLADASTRSDVYAWYSLVGSAGTAFGMMVCGWVLRYLQESLSWNPVDAYRVVFYGYAVLGLIKATLVLAMSREVEAEAHLTQSSSGQEATPLLQSQGTQQGQSQQHTKRSWLPKISRQSVSVVSTLTVLFALDSFASGLAPLSWITYYFKSHYSLDEGKLGSIFFVTSIVAAASMLAASSLAKRFGNVKTMVFTHLPSAIFLALIPVPNEVHLSILFLVLRACTQSMDAVPRSAFLAALLLPQERTVVLGLINVVKTTFQSLGPLITGLLADWNLFWVSFVCAGSLKASYDLGLLALFKNHEQDRDKRGSPQANESPSV